MIEALTLAIGLTFHALPANIAPPSLAPLNWQRVNTPSLWPNVWFHVPSQTTWALVRDNQVTEYVRVK